MWFLLHLVPELFRSRERERRECGRGRERESVGESVAVGSGNELLTSYRTAVQASTVHSGLLQCTGTGRSELLTSYRNAVQASTVHAQGCSSARDPGGTGSLECGGGRGGGGAATAHLYCSSACWKTGAWNQVVEARTVAMASST